MRTEFTAVIEHAARGDYWAYRPEIPGANGQGETVEECRENLRDSVALILQDRREVGPFQRFEDPTNRRRQTAAERLGSDMDRFMSMVGDSVEPVSRGDRSAFTLGGLSPCQRCQRR